MACSAAASMDTDYPGDPLTPGVGATDDAKRLAIKDARRSRRFPCCRFPTATRSRCSPRSTGPVAPENWRGALPITYHVGPGPAKVHLKVKSNWDHEADLRRDRDECPDRDYPDEWVIRGNHHDAWVNGAEDPISGHGADAGRGARAGRIAQAGMEAEAHHHLLRVGRRGARAARARPSGWKRMSTSCGSMPSLTSIPTPTAAGSCTCGGSHTLEKFINDVARDIQDPGEDMSVWQRAHLPRIAHAKNPEERQELRDRAELADSARWATAPTTLPFLDHAGIAALNLGLRRRGRRRHLSLRFTTIFTGTRISRIPSSFTDARWRRPAARRSCAWRTQT